MSWLLYHRERAPGTHSVGGWVGPSASQDVLGFMPQPSSPESITTLTELSQQWYAGKWQCVFCMVRTLLLFHWNEFQVSEDKTFHSQPTAYQSSSGPSELAYSSLKWLSSSSSSGSFVAVVSSLLLRLSEVFCWKFTRNFVSSVMAEESCDSFSYSFAFTSRAALKKTVPLYKTRKSKAFSFWSHIYNLNVANVIKEVCA